MVLGLQNMYLSLSIGLLLLSVVALSANLEQNSNESFEQSTEITSSKEASDETYAKDFPYGSATEEGPTLERRSGKTSRQGRAHIRIIHKTSGKPNTYAKKYRTWMPTKEHIKPIHWSRPKRMRPPIRYKRRRGGPGRNKIRPVRGNSLRKPKPPPEPDYEYFSDETYFPEETKLVEERPSQKGTKKRRPRPDTVSRKPYDENTSISYSNFIQHPSSTASTYDYQEYFSDEEKPKKKDRRRLKKKKKGSRKKVRDEDLTGAYSESSEEANRQYDKYPPYSDDDVQHHYTRPEHPPYPTPTKSTPIYGDGYIGNQQFQPSSQRNGYDNKQSRYHTDSSSLQGSEYQNNQYDPNYYNRNNNQPAFTSQQRYTPNQNNFANQISGYNQASQSSSYDNIQVAQPNFNVINKLNQQTSNTFTRPTNKYEQNYQQQSYNGYQSTSPTQNYQNIIPTTQYSSKYKSSSFFDNTATFEDFNRNVEFSQNSRFGVSNGRPSNFVPSSPYQESTETDNSFINRHLELYSNGMKGVPVQGDGFGGERRQESRTKDYDIGFGEIQYDETHHHS